jgi:hypothetical protein
MRVGTRFRIVRDSAADEPAGQFSLTLIRSTQISAKISKNFVPVCDTLEFSMEWSLCLKAAPLPKLSLLTKDFVDPSVSRSPVDKHVGVEAADCCPPTQ